ncbi:hypothetical protein phiCT19406C_22 (endogenous virus) [Clostridium phage phiCT19406C]|uniref:hypothetical protein n=1 Tax=Clostridium phage phiCT19406C TaxID=1567011 RepID=UPI000572AA9A|nr:hypothetical protein phiCT19406C_22 [Clostridium phage phiCT19406C]AJA42845.1 hypothetical protein phiCT19406C_22 [Clostridium phage phiCT19406C]
MFSYDNQLKGNKNMKVIIMNGKKNTWYEKKVGKVYKVQEIRNKSYVTKDGAIRKEDAEIIER